MPGFSPGVGSKRRNVNPLLACDSERVLAEDDRILPSVTAVTRRPRHLERLGLLGAVSSGRTRPSIRAGASATLPWRRRSSSDECRPGSTWCPRIHTIARDQFVGCALPPGAFVPMHTMRSANRVALLLVVLRRALSPQLPRACGAPGGAAVDRQAPESGRIVGSAQSGP